jgi:hypothetical protein
LTTSGEKRLALGHLALYDGHLADAENGALRTMKAYTSTLATVGLDLREKRARYRTRKHERQAAPDALVEVGDDMVPFNAVASLAGKLGIEVVDLLGVIRMRPHCNAAQRGFESG